MATGNTVTTTGAAAATATGGPATAARIRVPLRATAEQRQALQQAAAAAGRSVNAFVLDAACAAARSLLDARVRLPMEDAEWQRFLDLLGPAAATPVRPGSDAT